MTRRTATGILLAVVLALPSIVAADGVKDGRQYMVEQRDIMNARKILAERERETHKFESLLSEIDDLRLPRRLDDFWPVNKDVRVAMKRESEQHDSDRMNAVMRESQWLQFMISEGDMDVYPRYRYLLGEFLVLMKENDNAAADEIRRRETKWE